MPALRADDRMRRVSWCVLHIDRTAPLLLLLLSVLQVGVLWENGREWAKAKKGRRHGRSRA